MIWMTSDSSVKLLCDLGKIAPHFWAYISQHPFFGDVYFSLIFVFSIWQARMPSLFLTLKHSIIDSVLSLYTVENYSPVSHSLPDCLTAPQQVSESSASFSVFFPMLLLAE